MDAKTSDLVHLDHRRLSKFEDEYEKADNFDKSWVNKDWRVNKIFIEEAAMKFSPGFSSAGTIMTLGRFNGIISYMVYTWFGIKPIMVNVRSARKALSIKIDVKDKSKTTKVKVLEEVMRRNPHFPWISHAAKTGPMKGVVVYNKVNEDMADSWVIVRGGELLTP